VRVSLVMGTAGERPWALSRFLDSLASGVHQDLDLIVVDQGMGDQITHLLQRYRSLSPRQLRSRPGLSRARNCGLTYVTGEVVGFPDDDCWYPPDLLSSIVEHMQSRPDLGGVAVRPVDEAGRSSFPRWDLRPGLINRYNVWRRSNSNGLFLRTAVIREVGGFDEDLGVGSGTPWGAAEDVDYPLRVLAAGFRIEYLPGVLVRHPRTEATFDAAGVDRAERYGGGSGRVLRKHGYPWWFVMYQGMRPLGGALLSAATGRWAKAQYHLAVLRGRRRGWTAELHSKIPHEYFNG
jgi:glycosyltransferase involved in cell wall biosynthesis